MKAGWETRRKQRERALIRLSFRCLILPLMAAVAMPFAEENHGDGGHGHGHRPVYQRHAFERRNKHDRHGGRGFRHGFPLMSPPVSSGWFQRPYPYHLDYYKMRYGGSYAPYFGNLYGPSGLPAYFGPYYGAYGGGYAHGYPQAGYNRVPMEFPAAPVMMLQQGAFQPVVPAEQLESKSTAGALPTP